jgi:hypothetical protein
MGGIDAHLLEIQRSAADPIDLRLLQTHLAGLRGNLEAALRLDPPHADFPASAADAADVVRRLEGEAWDAETREEHYSTLRSLCARCHRAYAPPAEAPARRPPARESCGGCHPREFEEWSRSLHGLAWKDPVYRMSAGNPPKLECRGCHSMEPILARELSTEVSYRPVYRPYNQGDGVDCMACHGLADGSVAASRDIPGAPCRPRRDARLLTPEFCGACHNPSHGAYDEWKASGTEKTCTDCHALKDGRFSHRMLGARDPEFVKTGLSWSCEVAGSELRVTLVNRSGHKLPAEVPSRTLRVAVERDGREDEVFLRRPNKQIVGEKDNRLIPGETRVLRWDVAGARKLQVRILYQQSPFMMPEGWIEMGAWQKERP